MINGEGPTLQSIRRRIEDCEFELAYLRAQERDLTPKLLTPLDEMASSLQWSVGGG